MAVNLSQLGSFAEQAEGSAHDIITQFLGGPSQAKVDLKGYEAQIAQAKAEAATAAAAADTQAAATQATQQQYMLIAAGVLAVIVLVAVARR